jgi:hypothetical protein
MVKSAPKKASVVIREVPKTMINTGDVFILDTGRVLYQWNGRKSSGIERVKGAEYVHGIAAVRAGSVSVETIGKFSGEGEGRGRVLVGRKSFGVQVGRYF